MLIVGLTGSIGMGKSTAAARFRHNGIAVFDADAEVHRLYDGPLAAEIEAAFPGTVESGRVNRQKLAQALIAEPWRFREVESLVHPKVRASEREFLHAQHGQGAAVAVLEIPLLFEVGGNGEVDVTVVVSSGPDVQRERVLARPGMTTDKFEAIIRRQISDDVKRRRADFVVDTSGPVEFCESQIDGIVNKIRQRTGDAFERVWSA